MFKVHRVWSNHISIRNVLLLFFTIILGFASVITLAQIEIPTDIRNAWQTIGRITITNDWTDNFPRIDMSSWGIFIDPTLLSSMSNFSWKVLWIDDEGYLIKVQSQNLIISWGWAMNIDNDWTIVGNDIYTTQQTGNVGIGTTTMAGKLHIVSSWSTDVYIEEKTLGNAANLRLKNPIREWRMWADSNPDVFYIGTSVSPWMLNISSGGNVGIGTMSPKAKLQVVGNFIAGDNTNTITSSLATSVAWWEGNQIIDAIRSFIGGGMNNYINKTANATIVGWLGNAITANFLGDNVSFIWWWAENRITYSSNGFVWWGTWNILSGTDNSSIVGGDHNTINQAWFAFLWWWNGNTITANASYSVIVWGQNNTVQNATHSFAGGWNARALYNNTFVRNTTSDTFDTTKPGQFIINVPFISWVQGWVGINTNTPWAELDVNGNIIAKSIQLPSNSSINTGSSCGTTNAGKIIYKSWWFYGCDGNNRKQLNN